jgi:hypothetical protein
MLKERREAAKSVASTFKTAKLAQDQAAIDAADCLASALRARATTDVALSTGATAIILLAEGALHSVRARDAMIRAAEELAPIPHAIGLDAVGWGPTDSECTDRRYGTGAHLKSVA